MIGGWIRVAILPYLGGICRLFDHLAAFFSSF
jgi:hypothetical protein